MLVGLEGADGECAIADPQRCLVSGYEPDSHRVPKSPAVVGAPFCASDRGQLRADRGGQPLQHPGRGGGPGGQAHRFVQGGVEAFGAQRGDEQAEVGGGLHAVGQFEFQVAELVGDAFQGARRSRDGQTLQGLKEGRPATRDSLVEVPEYLPLMPMSGKPLTQSARLLHRYLQSQASLRLAAYRRHFTWR